MVKIGRIIGAIIALVGGGLTFYAGIISLEYLSLADEVIIATILTFILAALALLGGVLLILDKSMGGILAIIAGGVLIVAFWIDIAPFVTLAFHWAQLSNTGFYIDPLLIIVGGIIGLAVGSE